MRTMTTDPASLSGFHQTLTMGRLRGEWSELLAITCNDALGPTKNQVVSRYGVPKVAIVSTGWYARARRALGGEEPNVETHGSDDAKRQFAQLVDFVTGKDQGHCVIRADRYEIVVIVPVDWHQAAIRALGEGGP
ncbi:hypothetical protein [Streptomyces sp. CS014]|uniref:hypothetical protein n=1 Tax=Streptomyces sp. CS014 TaxID=2162707 RepID=UPI000D51D47F|nr:hypothetical protein [Streptomyces sp. CS014]PVD04430.1 hypothetical protein DBP12_03120 [Streptomyces sp. CS014]